MYAALGIACCPQSLAQPALKNENNRHSLKLDSETSLYAELVFCKFLC